jgi:CHAT domain-containing protein
LAIDEKALGSRHPTVAMVLGNLSVAYIKNGQFTQAEPLVERALDILADSNTDLPLQANCYCDRAHVGWHTNRREAAVADLTKAIDCLERQRSNFAGGETHRAAAFALFASPYAQLVAWNLELGHPDAAFAATERSRARSLIDQMNTAHLDLLAGIPVAEAQRLREREREALGLVASLEKQLEGILTRDDLTSDGRRELRQSLSDKLAAARSAVVEAYAAIRNASPVYRQMIGKDFKPSSLADVQQRLVGADGLFLEYFLTDEAGYVVIVPAFGGKARFESLTVSKEQAARLGIEAGPLTGTRMRSILSNDAGTGLLEELRDASKAEATADRLAVLWNVLVPAAEQKLLVEGKLRRLIVIPDAALAAFPFDTLVVEPGEKPKYLLDIGPPIVTAPSATLLINLSEGTNTTHGDGGAAAQKTTEKNHLLSIADPNYGTPSSGPVASLDELSARSRYGTLRGDLRPLPFTAWECSWVAETFRKAGLDASVLQKANAREASVRKYAPGRKYLHFACHGLVDQSYGNLFGALALTPGPQGSADPADDGFLTLAEIYELNLRGTELSILSACDTNFGPHQKGEGVWSLSRGFLVAGSKRVIASNWLVDDEAGASLISVFCSELVKSKADSQSDCAATLQAAKRWVRNQDKWRSPYYWATFVLVGPN